MSRDYKIGEERTGPPGICLSAVEDEAPINYFVRLLIHPVVDSFYILINFILAFVSFFIIKNIQENSFYFLFYFVFYLIKSIVFFVFALIYYGYKNCSVTLVKPVRLLIPILFIVVCVAVSAPIWQAVVAVIVGFVTNDYVNFINGVLINFVLYSPLCLGLSFSVLSPYFLLTFFYSLFPCISRHLFFLSEGFKVHVYSIHADYYGESRIFDYCLLLVALFSLVYITGFVAFDLFNVVLLCASALVISHNVEKVENKSTVVSEVRKSDKYFVDDDIYEVIELDVVDSVSDVFGSKLDQIG